MCKQTLEKVLDVVKSRVPLLATLMLWPFRAAYRERFVAGHQKEAMARKLRLRRRREAADSEAQKVLQGMSDVAHDKKKIEDQLEVRLIW